MPPEFPQVLLVEAGVGEDDAAAEVARQIEGLGIVNPVVIASRHGDVVARALDSAERIRPPAGADQEWAGRAGSTASTRGADAIVAVGGGRCIDIAKLAAGRAGIPTLVVPTQLSHDGICSPVAVVPNDAGRPESVGAPAPRAVVISIPNLLNAPPASLAAGIGDLLANPLALRDWSLAADRGLEEVDQRAWDLSVESFESVEQFLDDDPGEHASDPDFVRRLADALVLSGMAMIVAGTSRPASGGEHEISHAIDELPGPRALHGAQVAFGCIFSVHLYGEDTKSFRARLDRLGLPSDPARLGLSREETVDILLRAPDTRPGRFTIVEAADLDEAAARAVVAAIWPEE